ncbi:MAG: hypothetical protein MZU97_22175 [Bacillus subtilis]|nr:hypothetical protein [Bacillus subtilis]
MLERSQVLICGGTGCLSSHSKEIQNEFDVCLTKSRNPRRSQTRPHRLFRFVRKRTDRDHLSR